MKKRIIEYCEMTPDEGKMLTDGSIVTDYICCPNTDAEVSKWYEIDAPSEQGDEGQD